MTDLNEDHPTTSTAEQLGDALPPSAPAPPRRRRGRPPRVQPAAVAAQETAAESVGQVADEPAPAPVRPGEGSSADTVPASTAVLAPREVIEDTDDGSVAALEAELAQAVAAPPPAAPPPTREFREQREPREPREPRGDGRGPNGAGPREPRGEFYREQQQHPREFRRDRGDNRRDPYRGERGMEQQPPHSRPLRFVDEPPPAPLPAVNLTELKRRPAAELLKYAEDLGIEAASTLRKSDLVFVILKRLAETDVPINGEGVVEILQDGFGFLRTPDVNYVAGPDDIYVSPSQIRRFGLRTGDVVQGQVRAPKEGERYFALLRATTVNFDSPEVARHRVHFDNLTPYYPPRS
jgi:hypothetical protein